MIRLAVVLAAATLAQAGGARAEPPLWRAKSPTAEVMLFGSVHVLPPGLDWRTPKLEAALKGDAQEVWFEIPIDPASQTAASSEALARARLPEGRSLPDMLSPAGKLRLARIAAQYRLGDFLNGFKPWMADVILSARYAEAQGASRDRGVEGEVDRALPSYAPRRALETVAEQISLFADVAEAEQIASLEQTLEEIETDPDAYRRLVDAWMRGDSAAIAKEADELRTATPALYKRLVLDRNRRWATTIEAMLKDKRRAVMVVGVGHLVGPDSVPAMLRRDGVTVEGP